ncbi:DUF1289 domain-containing protein [Ramlibacter tataouinensis]|nr:DUF1289 domain-containing protein [Ramlibacter tataouinensis]WBY03980.1 DUF1289 domain-containing protein [Ramlibacter tataouinensis]
MREVAALPPGQPVPSPCVCICRIDPRTGLCDGCLRTIDEVAGWTSLDDAGKRAVWQRLGERAAAQSSQPSGEPTA